MERPNIEGMLQFPEYFSEGNEGAVVALATYTLALEKVATDLYMAGCWQREGHTAEEDAPLWESLRDALGLPAGTATAAGVAATASIEKKPSYKDTALYQQSLEEKKIYDSLRDLDNEPLEEEE
jgi:hypothetical protein